MVVNKRMVHDIKCVIYDIKE